MGSSTFHHCGIDMLLIPCILSSKPQKYGFRFFFLGPIWAVERFVGVRLNKLYYATTPFRLELDRFLGLGIN